MLQSRAVPDFGSGSGWNPELFPNPADIWLRQTSGSGKNPTGAG